MATKKNPSKKPDKKPEDLEDQDGTGEDGDDGDDGDDEQDQNQRINAIVTSRVKREMKAVNATLAQLTEMVKGLATQPKKTDEDQDDDGDGEGDETPKKDPKQDAKTARQLTKLQRELQDERNARQKAEQAQKEEYAKSQRQEMLNQFDAALTEHGVTDPKLRRAALRELEAEGYMVRDEESGKIKYKGLDKWGMEQMYDPKAGVKQWVTTEGKAFIPAVDAGGSGTGAARQGVGNTGLSKGEISKLSPQQKAAIELERASTGLPPLGHD